MNSTHGNMASLARGIVLGVLFGWGQETQSHTHVWMLVDYNILGDWITHTGTHWISRGWARRCSRMNYSSIIKVCNKPSEETYSGPLLVNIELPYPYREWPTISPPYEWSDRYLLSSPPNSWYPTRFKTAPQLCHNTSIHTRSKAYRNQYKYIITDSPQIQNEHGKLSDSSRNDGKLRTHKMFRYDACMLIFIRKRTEIFI